MQAQQCNTAETPAVTITGQAIDSASFRVLKHWRDDREEGEGLQSWLQRITQEALQDGTEKFGRLHHKGMKLDIDTEGSVPVLQKITRASDRN